MVIIVIVLFFVLLAIMWICLAAIQDEGERVRMLVMMQLRDQCPYCNHYPDPRKLDESSALDGGNCPACGENISYKW